MCSLSLIVVQNKLLANLPVCTLSCIRMLACVGVHAVMCEYILSLVILEESLPINLPVCMCVLSCVSMLSCVCMFVVMYLQVLSCVYVQVFSSVSLCVSKLSCTSCNAVMYYDHVRICVMIHGRVEEALPVDLRVSCVSVLVAI